MIPGPYNQPPHPDGPLLPGHELAVAEIFQPEGVGPYLTAEEQGGLSDAPILADVVIGSGEYESRERLHVFDLRHKLPETGFIHIQYLGKTHALPSDTLYWVASSQNDTTAGAASPKGLSIPFSGKDVYVSSEENSDIVTDQTALRLASIRLHVTETGALEIQNASAYQGFVHVETRDTAPESTRRIRADAAAIAGKAALAAQLASPGITVNTSANAAPIDITDMEVDVVAIANDVFAVATRNYLDTVGTALAAQPNHIEDVIAQVGSLVESMGNAISSLARELFGQEGTNSSDPVGKIV